MIPDQDRVRRVRITKMPARSAPASTTRSRNLCGAACANTPDARYRLPLPSSEGVAGKEGAVQSAGIPCGTTGAPVCPSNGQQIIRATLDD